MSSHYNLRRKKRSPEEGPSCGAGPTASGGRGHITIGQRQGTSGDPCRGLKTKVQQPENTVTADLSSHLDNDNRPESDDVSQIPFETANDQPEAHAVNENVSIATALTRSDNTTEPAARVLPASQPGTTKAGKPRQRMKWTSEMNEYVMRCYFIATDLDTISIGYRNKMHQLFNLKYPELNVTEQRVCDQKRVITGNKLLSAATIDEIKQQISREALLETRPDEQDTQPSVAPPAAEPETIENDINIDDEQITKTQTQNDENETEEQLISDLETMLIKYTGTNPSLRPKIPKSKNKKELQKIAGYMNDILRRYIDKTNNFTELHTLIYCAALTCMKANGMKIRDSFPETTHSNNKINNSEPKWQRRLKTRIRNLRSKINQLTQYKNGRISKKQEKNVKKILTNYKVHTKYESDNTYLDEFLDTLKQRLKLLAKRLKRYVECSKRKEQNKLFYQNEKLFYRQLEQTDHPDNTTFPTANDIEDYWTSIWSQKRLFNKNSDWLKREELAANNEPMNFNEIDVETVTKVIQTTHSWKATGTDHIHNFWYKQFKTLHAKITHYINRFITNPAEIPLFMTEGITYLLPKGSPTNNPAKYRPITCLQTFYKIMTSCLNHLIRNYCEENSILTEQQKGCRRQAHGSKEQLLIDSIVMKQAFTNNRNIYTSYIDYQKAFDSVPHDWLVEVLEIYKINPVIINCLRNLMKSWQTTIKLRAKSNVIVTKPIAIKTGIFQGDSLSPLWFCLALNPLSTILNDTSKGFNIKYGQNEKYTISHLMYMDDIKIYASTYQQLNELLEITERFSNDLCMKFGLDKCKTQCIKRGKREIKGYDMQYNEGSIDGMKENEIYKYLGIQQGRLIEDKLVKEELTNKYINRLKQVTKTKLHGKQMIKAINTYAVPTLTYSFGILKWTDTDIQALMRKTRKVLTSKRLHHPYSAIERLYLPRHVGGRGLIDLLNMINKQKNMLRDYFNNKKERSIMFRAICMADNNYSPLDLKHDRVFLTVSEDEKLMQWNQKALHGKHANSLSLPYVDQTASNMWLSKSDLFPETEGFMIAIQDQVIRTKNYCKYIIKDGTQDDTCRQCKSHRENIQHIISGCTTITQTDYKHRHDCVARILHHALALNCLLIKESSPYYKYNPTSVLENKNYKLYWDRSVLTDKTVAHNRPDIVLVNRKSKVAYFIDIAIPNTTNMNITHAEKIRKYTELAIEAREQWKMCKIYTLPVIISATGVVHKSIFNSLKTLGVDEHLLVPMQKSVVLSTCNTVRKFMNNPEN